MPERTLTGGEAIREALDLALERQPDVFLLGEGIADPKGIFGTAAGLVGKYGKGRVVEMPVAENGLTGIAVGAAMMGQRPVMVHQRVDFALLALEQLFNSAAKSHYVSHGKHRVPLTVRMIIGRGWGQGPAHSQSLETLFAFIPGLKVVMPFSPYDAKGLLLSAIEDDNPVMFLEHRWLHYVKGEVPEGYYTVPLTGPRQVREGGDVTIVATSYMVLEAIRVAEKLEKVGVRADVFDLRVLRPLNLDAIAESVKKTGRLVVVDTGFRTYGIGAEVVAAVTGRCFHALKAAPERIGLPEHPTPSSRSLAAEFYPSPAHILDAVARTLGVRDERLEGVRAELQAQRDAMSIDQPDMSFTGPF